MKTKYCNSCWEFKSITEFGRDAYKKDGLATICKTCRQEKAKAYYRTPNGRAAKDKYNTSKGHKLYMREYCKTEKYKKWQRQYITNKRLTDVSFKIRHSISVGIRSALKGNKNGRHWEDIVGYTLDDLMDHLEKQFLPNMSWSNYGDWHIDHIQPLCSFEFYDTKSSEFKDAWALENLRPLWAKDNLVKGGQLNYA